MPYAHEPNYIEPFASREHGGSGRGDVPTPSMLVSGSASISIPAGIRARPSSGTQVVRWLADDRFPSPLTALIDVIGPQGATPGNPFAQQAAIFAHADGMASFPYLGGVLRFVYGNNNVLRVLEADLRSGSFAIPNCTSCTVEAFLYLTGPGAVNVGASLIPGTSDASARLINSARVLLAAGASVTYRVPFGARWVSLMGGAGYAVGSGPNLLAYEASGNGAAIVQDYVSGTFLGVPGAWVELSGDRSDVIVKNNGAATATATLRFALEA